ncbi:carbon storage regulator [Bacillus velezensis]|uniref:carbon storage regulator n=1 Tax=Bacillus velezensis TaxID=492670 RepID=UPI003C12C189
MGGLVLSRKPEEGFYIIAPTGEKIFIKVLEQEDRTRDGTLRYYIQAPQDFQILREELYTESNGLDSKSKKTKHGGFTK